VALVVHRFICWQTILTYNMPLGRQATSGSCAELIGQPRLCPYFIFRKILNTDTSCYLITKPNHGMATTLLFKDRKCRRRVELLALHKQYGRKRCPFHLFWLLCQTWRGKRKTCVFRTGCPIIGLERKLITEP
jgi:hypothetical protein